MATLVQKIASQAAKTFKPQNSVVFKENLSKLKEMVQKVVSKDLNFDENLVRNKEIFKPENGGAPVTYLHLWEDHIFTMGIFVLKSGTSLPLHDHPGMHGIIKLIHGSLNVKSYSLVKDGPRPIPNDVKAQLSAFRSNTVNCVKVLQNVTVDTSSDACVLYPEQGNFHEIRATEGPAAFLDILSPPYDHGHDGKEGTRICRYYKVLNSGISETGSSPTATEDLRYFVEIPQPREFWCDAAPYKGPVINPYT